MTPDINSDLLSFLAGQLIDAPQEHITRLTQSPARDLLIKLGYTHQDPALNHIDAVLKHIGSSHTAKTPSYPEYTNPNSEAYSIVLEKLRAMLSTSKAEVAYNSPIDDLAETKTVAILVLDSHTDVGLRTRIAATLHELYSNPELHLSSGFAEGSMGSGYQELGKLQEHGLVDGDVARLMSQRNDIHGAVLGAINSTSNPALVWQAENISEVSMLEYLMKNLLLHEMGIMQSNSTKSIDIEKAKANKEHLRDTLFAHYIHFAGTGMEKEFWLALGLITRKILDKNSSYDPTTKSQIYNKTMTCAATYIDSKVIAMTDQPRARAAFQELATYDDHSTLNLLTTLKQNPQTTQAFIPAMFKDIGEAGLRNERITEQFASPSMGTRLMIIGRAHLDQKSYGDRNLKTLLEKHNIPVIVISCGI